MIHNSQGTLISNGEVPSRALIPFDPQLVTNSLLSRKELMKSMIDPRRDVNTECGYPETHAMNAYDYKQMYEREGVASRVVELEPLESWTVLPQVYEDEDEEAVTEFELGWKHLCDNFDSESWFKPKDDTHPVWEYLLRADILSGIGHFGVLLLGLDDGKDLREPVGKMGDNDNKPTTNVDFSRIAPEEREAVGKKIKPTMEQEDTDEEDDDENESEMSDEDADPPEQKVKLLYLQAFDESLIQIMAYEDNKNNPRFGQPVRYQLTLNDPVNNQQHGIGLTTQTVEVHWSRVIHVADNCTSSRVFGKPRQRPVWNRLLDCRKIYSSSGEGYWQGAFPGIALETHPQLGGDVTVDIANTRKQMYDYTNSLQRYIALAGMSAKTLNGTVTAPGPHVDAHIDAMCIQLGCPKRIFIGSERGELASSQDSDAWDDRIGRRRYQYLTPRIIVPFVDRLIQVEVLPQPKNYCVTWEKADQQTATDRAAFATQITTALSAYVSGGVDALMSPKDYLVKVCKFDSAEVDEILENALEHVNEANPDSEDVTVPGVQPTPPAPDVPDIIVDADGNAQPNPLAALGGKQGPPTVAGKPPFAKKSPVGNTGAKLETMGESLFDEYANLPVLNSSLLRNAVLQTMDELVGNYNPNQPRDAHGRWGSGGGGGGSKGGSAKSKGMPSKSAIAGLTKIQNLGGSTGATLVKDADGNKYVMKKGASPEHLRSEYAAENAYRAAGAKVPDSHLYETPDGPVKLSKFIVGKPYGELKGAEKEAARKQIQKDFAADAAFANWDVHGYGGENILVAKDGTAYRIDAGGALSFRAQGGPKGDKWNKDAGEFDTMRNGFQKGASSIFGDMTKEEISASFAKLDANSTKVVTALNNSGAKAEATMVSARLQSIAAKIDKMPDSGKPKTIPLPEGMTGKPYKSDKSTPVITSEKLSAVAAAAAGGTKPFSGNHSLTSAQTLADYVKANAGDQNFTKLKLEKMKFLNPDGLKNGTLFVPEAENKIMAGQLAQLTKIMPPGTQLKVVKNLSASKIGLSGLPSSNSKVVKNSTVPTTANPMAYKEASEVVKTKPTKVSPLAIKAEELTSQHKLVKEWKKNLNYSEQAAISSWKGSAKDMRKAITSNPPPPPSTAIDPKAHHFYKAIEKAPQIQGQVWRGVDGPYSKQTFDIMKAAGVGGEWSDTAPHCMSRDKSVAVSFGKDSGSNGLLLHIKTKTGRSIEYQSSHAYEQEVTGMPNTRYRILKIKDKPSGGSSNYGYHEVHLEEI